MRPNVSTAGALFLVLLLVTVLIVLSGSAAAPFIYTLF